MASKVFRSIGLGVFGMAVLVVAAGCATSERHVYRSVEVSNEPRPTRPAPDEVVIEETEYEMVSPGQMVVE